MSFLGRLLALLKDLVTSKKFAGAVLSGVAAMVIKDPATRQTVVEVGMAYIVGQGIADHGKAKGTP